MPLCFNQSPLFSAAFTAAAAPTPFDTGNSFCFAKVTGLKEAAFLRAAGCSCPLPSSAALRSALLVSVSDTLMLSARPEPSVAVISSDLIRKPSAALDRPCESFVASSLCNLSEQEGQVENLQCLAYLRYETVGNDATARPRVCAIRSSRSRRRLTSQSNFAGSLTISPLASRNLMIGFGRRSVGRREIADRLFLVHHIVDTLLCHNKVRSDGESEVSVVNNGSSFKGVVMSRFWIQDEEYKYQC